MDGTNKLDRFSPEMYRYVEAKNVFGLFSTMLEHLMVDRPDNPIYYLYELLVNESKDDAYLPVPKVFVWGPPVSDRKLICSTLALKFNLVHLTIDSLIETIHLQEDQAKDELSASDCVKLIMNRISKPDCCKRGWILDGLPRKREQAFMLRQSGIFPTHIVVLDDPNLTSFSMPKDFRLTNDSQRRELADFLGQKTLMIDLHKNDYVKTFDLASNSPQVLIKRVSEFLQRRAKPPCPYVPRLILLGPYGSGRRTLAQKLAKDYRLLIVDFQEELRRAAMKDSSIKREIQAILKTPAAVPDDLLARIAAERLKMSDCIMSGWVMYNFPHSLQQAQYLKTELEGFQVNRVVFLEASVETCLDRVEPRRLDPSTGELYHMKKDKGRLPRKLSVSRLFQRLEDETEAVVADRELYESEKSELAKFYAEEFPEDIAFAVDAEQTEDKLYEAIVNIIVKSAKFKTNVSENVNT